MDLLQLLRKLKIIKIIPLFRIISLPKCYDACDAYGMPKAISRFVLPIAGTMKSDASGIFIVSAVFYVVQVSNVALDIGKVIIVM